MLNAPRLDPSRQPWMTEPGARAILAAVKKAGGEARFVGGAVRDALLGREVADVDLAVNLPPQKVMKALKAAGIKVVPTGLDHGTVTAVVDGKGHEITALRRDVETYGRRAKVEFTDDWKTDASRRDFTFNALYADSRGKVYDYFDGIKDLRAGRVRFIGNASDRINEDVLRILRFFRFYAWYGRGTPDKEGLRCCRSLAPLMHGLSAERVWKELNRLLQASDPAPAVRLMIKHGVLFHVLPEAKAAGRLEKLVKLEKEFFLVDERSTLHTPPLTPPQGEGDGPRSRVGKSSIRRGENPSIRRLAALIGFDKELAEDAAKRLRLSRREAERLVCLAGMPVKLRGRKSAKSLRRLMYEYYPRAVSDGLLLRAAGAKAGMKSALATVEAWEFPVFQIKGEDILKLGVKPGPRIGKILRAVEEWWIARDFKPTRAGCLAEAKRRVKENAIASSR